MTDIVIQTQDQPEVKAEAEAIDAAAEAIETVSDNEVTIAAIEAEKEIAIAEIHAEARVAEAEAFAEVQETGQETWKQELTDLRLTVSELKTQVATLTAALIMPASLALEEAEIVAEAEAEAMNDLTPEFTSPPTSETPMEVIDAKEEESPVLAVQVKGKPIIQLV